MRLLALALGLISSTALAQGYVRTSINGDGQICIFWAQRTYTFYYDSAGSAQTPGTTEFDAFDAAFQTWQTVSDQCSDFQFVKGGLKDSPVVGYTQGSSDNYNVLTFRENSCDDVPSSDPCWTDDSCANTYRCWNHDPQVIALTTTTYSIKTGTIFDADIEFNAAPQFGGPGFLFTTVSSPSCTYSDISTSCVANDVQNTATHEIGHVIGLAHDPNPASTMLATAPLGETQKRIIDIGTASGFCDIYPRGQPSSSACDLTGQLHNEVHAQSSGTSLGCSAAPSSTGVAALWLWALALVFQRRVRR
jgi:hypothetical protein